MAFALGGERHELSLHVGGEAWVLLGGDVGGLEVAAGVDADVIAADADFNAALFELADERTEVLWLAAVDVEVAAGDGTGEQEGAGFDAIGIDAMAGAVEFGDSLDLDGGGTGAWMLAPMAWRSAARSVISGSRAQFSRMVSPSARTAAIRMSSVPVTVILSKRMCAPLSGDLPSLGLRASR